MKVLVVQQRYGIGDMLIFLPYLKALSEKNNVKISLLAKKTSRSSELFKLSSRLIVFCKSEYSSCSYIFKYCFGNWDLESGQSLVPLPPDKIIGIIFNFLVESSKIYKFNF